MLVSSLTQQKRQLMVIQNETNIRPSITSIRGITIIRGIRIIMEQGVSTLKKRVLPLWKKKDLKIL